MNNIIIEQKHAVAPRLNTFYFFILGGPTHCSCSSANTEMQMHIKLKRETTEQWNVATPRIQCLILCRGWAQFILQRQRGGGGEGGKGSGLVWFSSFYFSCWMSIPTNIH